MQNYKTPNDNDTTIETPYVGVTSAFSEIKHKEKNMVHFNLEFGVYIS